MNLFKTFCHYSVLILLVPGAFSQQTNWNKIPDYTGENLEYSISYSFLRAGKAIMSFNQDSLSSDYHIKAFSKTVGLADVLYRIRDIYECYMSPETGLPRIAIRNVREGNYRQYNEVQFDHNIRPDSSVVTSQLTGVHVVPKNIFDILSGFYYFRNNYIPDQLNRTDTILIKTYFTDEIWDLKIKYDGKGTVKTKVGKIKCLKFDPITEIGRAFKTEHDMSVWFSADSNRIPVKVRLNLVVGSVRVELVNYSGLKHELSSLKLKK